MNKEREALKLALEALEKLWNIIDDIDTYGDMAKDDEKLYRALVERRQRTRFEETGITTDGYELSGGAITAIREALAQPEQEPVAKKHEPRIDLDKYAGTYGGYTITQTGVGIGEPEQEPVAGQPLPCPFCGHIGLDFSDGNTYRWGIASCGGCGASCGEIRREYPDEGKWHSEAIAEWNRRITPPQPQQNQFNPDWDAMAVMVEEQQRMAKRIEELEAHRKPLTDDEIWKNDAIMSANSGYGATFDTLRELTRAIEAAHGIKD